MPHIDTQSAAERFEAAFNRVQHRLMHIARGEHSDAFLDLLYHARPYNSVIRTHFDKLKQYAKLRNAIVHEKTHLGYYIAEPHEDVVLELERISSLLENPPSIMTIASQPVSSFDLGDTLRAVLTCISETGHSQFPVYNGPVFHGLLTEGGIARWLARQSLANPDEALVRDVLAFESEKTTEFIARSANVFEAEEVFEDTAGAHRKLEALIITHNGSKTAPPLGIITSWDLVKIHTESEPAGVKQSS